MAAPSLEKAAKDRSASVAVLAAEALYLLGQKETALNAYTRILTDPSYEMMDRNFALNSVDALHLSDPELIATVKVLYDREKEAVSGFARFNAFDFLMSEYLLQQWGVI
jgi:hypothetical protein